MLALFYEISFTFYIFLFSLSLFCTNAASYFCLMCLFASISGTRVHLGTNVQMAPLFFLSWKCLFIFSGCSFHCLTQVSVLLPHDSKRGHKVADTEKYLKFLNADSQWTATYLCKRTHSDTKAGQIDVKNISKLDIIIHRQFTHPCALAILAIPRTCFNTFILFFPWFPKTYSHRH